MQKTTYQIYDFFNQNIKSDIQAITINLKQLLEESTILTFGWNCQEFSIRNQNQNPQSERATAFRYALKLIDIAKPKMIIIENVLRTPKEYIFEIEHFLKSIGYHVLVTFQKNLSQFGAFQIRQRLFIIAIKSENINGEFTKPYSPTYQPNKIPISCVLDSPYADPFVRPNEIII